MTEPESTGVEVDKTKADYAYNTSDKGRTGHVTCWDGKPPIEGDYLILRNGELGNSRYKAVKVEVPLGPEPRTMWTAGVRHAPSTNP